MKTLFTFGYSEQSANSLLAFCRNKKAHLMDIRYMPYSRSPEWDGSFLARMFGDDYSHNRWLGNIAYKQGKIIINDPKKGMRGLVSALSRMNVVILCACKDHHSCHRATVADMIPAEYKPAVIHLKPSDMLYSERLL